MKKTSRNIFFITDTLPPEHGGRTRSLLARARVLTENLISNITILTTNFNANYDEVYNQFLQEGWVNEKIRHINMYDDIMKNNSQEYGFDNYKAFLSRIVCSHSNNMLGKQCDINIVHSERKISIYAPKVKIYLWLDGLGNVYKKATYPSDKPRYCLERFYDRAGEEYLIRTLEEDDKNKFRIVSIIYLNGKYSEKPVHFLTERELITFWYDRIIPEKSTVINDARLLDCPLLDLRKGNVIKIFQLHSTHLKYPADNANVKGSFRQIIEYIKKPQSNIKVVSLTDKQALDLQTIGCNIDNLKVIPHSCDIPQCLSQQSDRKDIVVIGRLAKEKNLKDVILAFDRLPQTVKLHFYGDGPEKSSLQKIVERKRLSDRVFFHGLIHPSKVNSVLQSAKCTVLTSDFEGFALSVQESIVNGCPSVSYDIKYGPSTIIENGKNGFLVKQGDIDALSEKLNLIVTGKAVFEQHELQKTMKKFSQESFLSKWVEIINPELKYKQSA